MGIENEEIQELPDEDTSIRDALDKAFTEAESKAAITDGTESEVQKEVQSENPESRDDKGRFAKKEEATTTAKTEEAETQLDPVKPSIVAPVSWKPDAKAKWEKLPEDIKAEINKREKEVELGFTKLDEERNFGKALKEVITPYMSIINAEGGTPVTAIQSLLNTAYYLRSTATPQEKGKMIINLAKQFNADITQTQNNTTPVQPDQIIAQTQQEIAALREEIKQQPIVFRQQQETTHLQSIIDAFAADPKNVHYPKLKPVMASLLQTGQAKNLQEAYEKASWADPEIRSSIMAEQAKEIESKRIANIKAKTGAARKVAVSIKGSPGISSATNGDGNGSIREQLNQAWDEHAS